MKACKRRLEKLTEARSKAVQDGYLTATVTGVSVPITISAKQVLESIDREIEQLNRTIKQSEVIVNEG